MAAESVSASEFHELAVRYEALEKQANNLLAAMGRGRAIRNILLLALLILVGALTYTIYQMGNRLTSPKFMKELADGAQARMDKNSQSVQKHLVTLYEKSNPVLMKAFQDQVEKDRPKYVAAAEKEWPKMRDELHKKMEERMLDQYKAALAEIRPELEKMCPELKDEKKYDRLTEGLVSAAERSIEKSIVQQIDPRFQKVELSWKNVPPAPKPKEGDPSVGEQIIGHLVELLGTALTRGDALAAFVEVPEKPATRRAAPPKAGAGKGPVKGDENTKKGG